jgi:cell division protein FtsX
MAEAAQAVAKDFTTVVNTLASLGDRSTGTPGGREAARLIKNRLSALGVGRVESHEFSVPVVRHGGSAIVLPDRNLSQDIHPLQANVITPGAIDPEGWEGPLIYAGSGELREFNGKEISGAVVLMEMDSGKNWLHAANLGAKALIYVDRGLTGKTFFQDKTELSPIRFPRFWIPLSRAKALFGNFEAAPQGLVAPRARLFSRMTWEEESVENIIALIPGTDPRLHKEWVMVEAFYDSTALIPGNAPGADEACSVATLLDLARTLKHNPPARSVLLVATAGHAQALAGMRELTWSLRARATDLQRMDKRLESVVKKTRKVLKALERDLLTPAGLAQTQDEELAPLLAAALTDRIKAEADHIARRLIQLRMQQTTGDRPQRIREMAQQSQLLRRLIWRGNFKDLTPSENQLLQGMIPFVIKDQQAILSDAERKLKQLRSTHRLRALLEGGELAVAISLHLSSHGDGIGAFSQGWLYPLKETVKRQGVYALLAEELQRSAQEVQRRPGVTPLYRDTLQANHHRPWQSYFPDQPFLGGEVSALAGYLGLSLATVNDARPFWGTPYDRPETVNWEQALQQSVLVSGLIGSLVRAPRLHTGRMPANGFSTLTGRVNLLRHGELFADQPAPGSVILAYHGATRYYAVVDAMGTFQLRGLADRKHLLDNVILEGYRFDRDTGATEWAVDKQQTGINAYRVAMRRNAVDTNLVMFACKATTLFNLMEPRSFRYLTKIQLLDGRREALPLRYWFSRIDTRSSTIASVYLEPGTRFKMTLSDTVFNKKLILTGASGTHPEGLGYLVDDWPFLHHTELKIAQDMWALLEPRIANLETHGIYNERIRLLHREGAAALQEATRALKEQKFDQYAEAAQQSWALATRVYEHVESTQKDVLFGVLFYIALFVPFAFCLERLLFCYTDIYLRVVAFCGILILLIALIYQVHPAFQLAYNPMVVILAFFIIGLSLMVTLIIFFRFESEMERLQRQAGHRKGVEISPWKAFVAAFFLGVSNLRRRRLRTALTCITLIILTFTIMSFTTVKTMRQHGRLWYQSSAPYQGFLLKNLNWQDLPPEVLGILANAFEGKGEVTPRIWLEGEDRTRSTPISLRYQGRAQEAQALIGLGEREAHITQVDQTLIAGRWLLPGDRHALLLSERMAGLLGIDPHRLEGKVLLLWGMPFTVVGIFSGEKFEKHLDLDGESLTPVTFPSEVSMEMTEVEMEAAESGADLQSFQSRYRHVAADLTVIVPYRTLMAAGGRLKSLSVRPYSTADIQAVANELTDRFGLSLFCGEPKGTFLYSARNTLSYSGVPNILIPLIISVFIVLNTMIGSVYERKREIAVYTSVGLAPSHVSFLFIAEAMAFAVLSVVLGYLLAQSTASLFAASPLWAGITVNYSSLAGVGAMCLVILVVLVSVIYPSRVAARIAIPDVNRSWKLPEPEGNHLEVTLPFLMKHREHRSSGGYLYDYFKGYQDVSQGAFSTGDIDFAFVCPVPPVRNDLLPGTAEDPSCWEPCLRLYAQVWLAPFDFGIKQQVEVQFCPAAEEPGFLEIKILMKRLAGEANVWRRTNRAFLHAVRRQLLMWRSLDEMSQAHYERLIMSAAEERGGGRGV